jgi:hypothetical protein
MNYKDPLPPKRPMLPAVIYTLSAVRYTLYEISRTNLSAKKMQNKPNFLKPKMNLKLLATKGYENNLPRRTRKNKANSNPIKACPIKACPERSRMGQS